jgi:hypothetical protein
MQLRSLLTLFLFGLGIVLLCRHLRQNFAVSRRSISTPA